MPTRGVSALISSLSNRTFSVAIFRAVRTNPFESQVRPLSLWTGMRTS